MSEDFLKRSNMQKERHKNYKYNHRTSRKGYANLGEELKKEGKLPPSVDRATLWKHARVGKDGEFMNKEVEEIVAKTDKLQKNVDKTYSVSDDILTQALGTPEHRGRGRPCSLAVGKVDNIVAIGIVFERISTNEIVYRVRLGEGDVWVFIELACDSHSLLPIPIVGNIYSVHDAIGSHVSWQKYLIVIEEQKKTSSKKPRELEALKGTKLKMNELKLSTTIRFVLRHVEKDMNDEYLTIPVDTQEIFGYSFNVNVMKDSIKQLCLMEELALSVILSYIICLYESDPCILEEYEFMNPGQISKGLGTDEHRARHLCNRLCAQQSDSTECGSYVMKFMQDIVRQKSITITVVLTRQAPYTQSELDMVRVEYCDFLGCYI
ncbi:uncharacterized protein E5676_scaffold204G00800 [Cucumis melo var. makuwa]|uniref:DUF8039 domain-containing protein n=1 Tax=Cucumis melo var. makuwa TaxID=1194695 RepID=A0A5D3D5S7_CUCMM|nr:uncharacterized protein E5676_scaffold204G00800 [Cucumis melo var. makuwa]